MELQCNVLQNSSPVFQTREMATYSCRGAYERRQEFRITGQRYAGGAEYRQPADVTHCSRCVMLNHEEAPSLSTETAYAQ